MVAVKNLNNFSKELKEQIPHLEDGQEVVFQMLNGHPNNDPDVQARAINPILYGKTQIPTYFRVKDPHSKDIIHVGVAQGVKDETVVSFKPFLAGQYEGIFSGKFSLIGGNVEDEELYRVFWLHPEREGSPCQDKSVRPLFKIVNPKDDNKKVLTKVDTLRKALDILKALSTEEFEEIAASQNWGGDEEGIKAKVSDLAKSNPELFISIQADPITKKKAKIKAAIDKSILKVDQATRKVTLNDGNELFTIAKDSMSDQLSAVTKWIEAARNGKEIYEGILKQLGAGNK